MQKLLRFVLPLAACGLTLAAQAQTTTGGVGIGTATPAASAILDLTATNKGLLPPRLTQALRDAIAAPAAGLTIYNTDTGKLNTWNGFYWAEAVQGVPAGGPQTLTFNYTGSPQTWTVPAGVTSVQVDLGGARGFFIQNCSNCYRGGSGGRVQATLAVTAGQVLTIVVGGAVTDSPGGDLAGGYNGGGGGTQPGGGATDIRLGGTALANRVLVAGGGGGGGYNARGGPGGGLVGGTGLVNSVGGGSPGTGGTQSAGGTQGGSPDQYCYCSTYPAALGQGGGKDLGTPSRFAGGGGGGYYGGGATYNNGNGAGAGGGSSYADPALATNVVHTQGYQFGAGYARLTFSFQPEAPTISLNNATTSQAAGSVIFSDGSKLAGNAGQLFWDNPNTRLGIGTSSPQAKLHVAGAARIDGLAGTGTRMVTTDASGNVSSAALPSGDNLGNHAATQALVLNEQPVLLRGSADQNHQLRYNGGPDGPQLMGYGGGELGYNPGSGFQPVLRWNNSGYVGIGLNPGSKLDIQTEARSGTHATGRPLYVTGFFDEAAGGPEFRHSNGTQGVGIGYNSLYAAGSNTDQPLNLMPKGSAGVGIGTTSPSQKLQVEGQIYSSTGGFRFPDNTVQTTAAAGDNLGNHTATTTLQMGSNQVQFGLFLAPKVNLWNGDYTIGVQGGTQYFRSGDAFAWYTGGGHHDSQFNPGGGNIQMLLKNNFLGVGTGFTSAGPQGPLEVRRDNASPYLLLHDPNDAWASFGMDYNDGRKIKLNDGNGFGGTNYITFSGTNVGLGTTSPAFPLDVQNTVTPGNYAYAFFAANGNGTPNVGSTGANTGPVSIRATGRVLASEFNATSDRRLKNVIGRSNNAADLALLNKLRITDYTMRDRVQYGPRQFKKVIAQEVEQVFPQAVNQHAGFLPDVYVNAVKAELQADSLLVLTLPAAPATAAQAGQRLKLIAKTGEVVGTVQAARGNTLVVRGARQLAGQDVFVFGLEHADVRTVDYEALSMLNVSATQELARKIAALETQNATLRQQNQQQQQALHTLQTETTATTASLAERLKNLENLLGAKAEAK